MDWDEIPEDAAEMMRIAMRATGDTEWVGFWASMVANQVRIFPLGPARLPTLVVAYDAHGAMMAVESRGLPLEGWDAEIQMLEAAINHVRSRNHEPRGQG